MHLIHNIIIEPMNSKNVSGGNTMIRKIIKIDEAKCNGCGACATACHEGAIEMIDVKAKLTK